MGVFLDLCMGGTPIQPQTGAAKQRLNEQSERRSEVCVVKYRKSQYGSGQNAHTTSGRSCSAATEGAEREKV